MTFSCVRIIRYSQVQSTDYKIDSSYNTHIQILVLETHFGLFFRTFGRLSFLRVCNQSLPFVEKERVKEEKQKAKQRKARQKWYLHFFSLHY